MSDITANVVVSMPSQLFTMARSFKAVANGKIYIGKIDTDPVNPENQIQVYVENEDGSHVPVSQPIIINAAGYPVYNGQIAKFVTVQGHSMAVYDAYGVQQFYFHNVLKYDPDQFRQTIEGPGGADLIDEGRLTLYKKYGSFQVGGIVSNQYQGMLHSDGFYYVKTDGVLPFNVDPGSAPDNRWSCVGLLNQYPLYSPENFGYRDGDDAGISMQLAMDAMPYNGIFELVDGSVYTMLTPVNIKKTGFYRGAGNHQKNPSFPTVQQHAQIISKINGPAFIITPWWLVPVGSRGVNGDHHRYIENFTFYADRSLYPQSGFLAGQGSQTTTVIRGNHIRGCAYGICALTSYGMLIQSNVFYDVLYGVTANPATYQPQGPADIAGNGQKLWQTNVIEIRNNYFDGYTSGEIAVDVNCPGNQWVISENTIERFTIPIQVSSLNGYTPGDDGRVLRALTITDNYLEASRFSHIVIGRSISGFTTADSAPTNVLCVRNTLNNSGIPDANAAIFILACISGKFDNSGSGRPTSQLAYSLGGSPLSSVEVTLYASEATVGYMQTNSGNKILFRGASGVRDGSLSILYVNPDSPDAIPGGQELQWWSGLPNKPFSSFTGAMVFVNEMRDEYTKKGITSVEVRCAGSIGPIIFYPECIKNVTLSVSSGTPTITGMSISGANLHIVGAFILTNSAFTSSTAPWTCFKSNVSIEGASFNFTGYPAGTSLMYGNLNSNVSLVNCTAVAQLPITSDRSIFLMSSAGLTGTQNKVRGGQFFS